MPAPILLRDSCMRLTFPCTTTPTPLLATRSLARTLLGCTDAWMHGQNLTSETTAQDCSREVNTGGDGRAPCRQIQGGGLADAGHPLVAAEALRS